jgi:hypothetical protein
MDQAVWVFSSGHISNENTISNILAFFIRKKTYRLALLRCWHRSLFNIRMARHGGGLIRQLIC